MLVGTKDAMEQARLYRKRLGGGMRQAGVLAAAGMIALEDSPTRLGEDHRNARHLAQRLAEIHGIQIQPSRVQTNILIFGISGLHLSTPEFSKELKRRGVLANGINATEMRMVTHVDVTRDDCERAAGLAAEIATVAV